MNNPRKELNILLLGQTGCGKTTFINALCNYFQYKTFDDALHKLRNLHIVIPTRYSWTLPNYEQVDVVLGEHDNECREGVGVSATQWPREIVYNYGNDYIIRLIDTPGFGDTSGTDKDKVNSERILTFIHQYSHLHAVCILFKPTETRNTNLFRYCFNTLFTQMHRNIFKNIICVFSFTKGTNFQPGETLALLRDGLRQVQESQSVDNVDMTLGRHNIVCFENDCFNFLGAVKMGVCDTTDKDNYLTSWERSSKAANNLVEMVKNLKPYSVNELTSLRKVRQASMKLVKIYKELKDDIEIQYEKLESMSGKLEEVEKRIQELIPFTYDITKHRKEGQFILCFNNKCRKRDDLGNYNMCRNDSGSWGSFLKFDMLGITCQYCNCNMVYHSSVKQFTIQKKEVNKRGEELMTKEIIKRNQAKLDLKKCCIDTDKLKNEKEILNTILLQIFTLIDKNSMISSRGMFNQINLDIQSEKTKRTPNVRKIKKLEEELQMQQHLNELQFQFEDKLGDVLSIEAINDTLLSLQTLPYIGPKMKELYATDLNSSSYYYESLIVNPNVSFSTIYLYFILLYFICFFMYYI